MKIIFMGTPEFAVATLDLMLQNKFNIVAVITVPDKPAGRGLALQESAVKKYSFQKGLKILQPLKLKDENFIAELKSLNADLQVVVAFRMLPEVVWNMPSKGTINLHGSLLPQYRGAAPINWAIINGEKETGVSTFLLQREIDTGKIIFREKINIGERENAGEVHDKLMATGARLIVATICAIAQNNYPQIAQEDFLALNEKIKIAPKILKDDCKIDWKKSVDEVHNFIRGLSPYPTAYTTIMNSEGQELSLKIFESKKEIISHNHSLSKIITDEKTFLKIAVVDGYIDLLELQLAGKKRMNTKEFLRGVRNIALWYIK